MFIFNGTFKIIQLQTDNLDVKLLYSKWKEWVRVEGSKFLPAFSTIGGEPIDVNRGIFITTYYFLINGWRIRPKEENHRLRVFNGVLLTDIGDSPFISTVGNYNVFVEYSQPIKTESVRIENNVSGLTPEESQALLVINQIKQLCDAFPTVLPNNVWQHPNRSLTNVTNIKDAIFNEVL